MFAALRVSIALILIKFGSSAEKVVFPEPVRNDFASPIKNLFASPTVQPADLVVAQALVEEVTDPSDYDTDYDEEKQNGNNHRDFRTNNSTNSKSITNKNKIKDLNPSETKLKSVEDKDHDKIAQVKKQYKGKKGHKSAKFGEKKGHKKGHKTKGYNNRFHKDEYHKEHKLYGDAYRDNSKNIYKDAQIKHGKKAGGFTKANHKSHTHSDNRFGKKGVDDIGKFDDRDKDYEKASGHANKNKHHTQRITIKDERNPYPNHRPY